MDEDTEIELLLNANEEILMEASTELDRNVFDPAQKQFSSDRLLLQKQNELENYNDEIQELINQHIVSYMVKEPKKHLQLYYLSSDEDSVDSYVTRENVNDQFIKEISFQNEPYSTKKVTDRAKSVVGSEIKQNKQVADSELRMAHKLIVEKGVLLQKLENKLIARLSNIKDDIQDIRYKISLSSGIEGCAKIKVQNPSRHYFKKFGAPYMKNKGFSAPINQDHKQKLQSGEAQLMYLKTPTYWTKDHQQMLVDAIKETLIQEKTDNLTSQINKITRELKNPDTNKGCLKNILFHLQQELTSLPNQSFTKLISEESPDRNYDWMKYSLSLFNGNHTHDECKRFWNVYLKPSINKSNWSQEEDLKLLDVAEQMQYQDWNSIAMRVLTNRSAYQCFVHFQTRLNAIHEFSKGKWTKEEDEKLLNVIQKFRIGDYIPWTKVSCQMSERNPVQIYNRYKNCLNPKLVKGRFTRGEDMLIVAGIEVFDCNYKEIASLFTNRTPSQIRERCERYLLPRNQKVGSWTVDEDERLIKLVKKHGDTKFSEIAKEMKTRNRTQIRQRYRFIQQKMKEQPGLTLDKLNRRNVHIVDKTAKKTEGYIRKVKEEVRKVEQLCHLSKIEKNKFRMEKLREVRDKVLSDTVNLKKLKCRDSSDTLEDNSDLLEFFNHNQIDPPKCAKLKNVLKTGQFLNSIMLLAKNLGHNLILPIDEREILNNSRLSQDMKRILLENRSHNRLPNTISGDIQTSNTLEGEIDYAKRPCNKTTDITSSEIQTDPFECEIDRTNRPCIRSFNTSLEKIQTNIINSRIDNGNRPCNLSPDTIPAEVQTNTIESSIDYVPPETDSSIIVNQWCSDPPIDPARLNFSELFKRNIFDYSCGMHRDIWNSKLERSLKCSFTETKHEEVIDDDDSQYNLPPSHLTTLGLKSLFLSKSRLKQDKLAEKIVDDCINMNTDTNVDVNIHLNQFQETLEVLFSWPRVLSLASVFKTTTGNPIVRSNVNNDESMTNACSPSQRRRDALIRRKNNLKTKMKATVSKQRLKLKCKARKMSRGNTSERKMNIKHLLAGSSLKNIHGESKKKSKQNNQSFKKLVTSNQTTLLNSKYSDNIKRWLDDEGSVLKTYVKKQNTSSLIDTHLSSKQSNIIEINRPSENRGEDLNKIECCLEIPE